MVAGIGTYLLSASHAASPYVSLNADKGILTGPAVVQTNSTASDGKSVKFRNSGGTPITAWVARTSTSFTPLSDSVAASLITLKPENRPGSNTSANNYVPTDNKLQNFQISKDQFNQTPVQENPFNQFVDGWPGNSNPSTDDLIQWKAQKWGIPEDWLRAQYVLESYLHVETLGDQTSVSAS